jgi:hypothetical protein
MTGVRMVFLLAAILLFADYKYGNARLIESLSAQAAQLGDALSDRVAVMLRRLSR